MAGTWDAENRVSSITRDGLTTYFTYDGDGARVKKEVNGAVTYYVGNLYEESDFSRVWIPLAAGWNLISLPLEPLQPYTAEGLCQEINAQGGEVVEIDRWRYGGWQAHVCGLPFNNFTLELGRAYFVRSNVAATWLAEGSRVREAVPLALTAGWNSFSIPQADTYTAEAVCSEAAGQGISVAEVDRWYAGGWNSHICGLPFNDFPIVVGQGYMLLSNSEGTWTPAAPGTVERRVTRYYYFHGQRVAMREGPAGQSGAVYYIHQDHLGSTTLLTDESGAVVGRLKYYPYGTERWSQQTPFTDYRFTGQRLDEGTGLYYYGARYYDAALGRFVQADTIVPEPGNPQALNRYSYVLNNPLKYIDPSGYDPIDTAWEQAFYGTHGRWPTDDDRRDRFFSLLFFGSGPNGAWMDSDWNEYSAHRGEYWSGQRDWPGGMASGLDSFVTHLNRLASYYSPGEEAFFAQAIGFVWGGVPLGNFIPATWQMATNPGAAWARYTPLFEGTENWRPELVDDPNPSHHYAGLFYMGFFFGPYVGHLANWLRDGSLSDRNVPDLNSGYLAANQGAMLYDNIISMSEVGSAARYALDARAGIWPMNTPGSRVPWYYPSLWVR